MDKTDILFTVCFLGGGVRSANQNYSRIPFRKIFAGNNFIIIIEISCLICYNDFSVIRHTGNMRASG